MKFAFAIILPIGGTLLMFWAMEALGRLRDRKFPPPVVGQVWRSRHSGHRIRVSEVRKHHNGDVIWCYQSEMRNGQFNPICASGEWGLSGWRCFIRMECRELELTTETAAAGA